MICFWAQLTTYEHRTKASILCSTAWAPATGIDWSWTLASFRDQLRHWQQLLVTVVLESLLLYFLERATWKCTTWGIFRTFVYFLGGCLKQIQVIIWDYTIQYNENITIHEGISSNISTKGTTQGFEHCSSDKDVWYFLFDKDVWHFMFGKKHEVPSGYLYIYIQIFTRNTLMISNRETICMVFAYLVSSHMGLTENRLSPINRWFFSPQFFRQKNGKSCFWCPSHHCSWPNIMELCSFLRPRKRTWWVFGQFSAFFLCFNVYIIYIYVLYVYVLVVVFLYTYICIYIYILCNVM